jgi:AcrR family transcriptional regulator
MARPQKISDEQILRTMRECVLELGPQVSLDLVAEKLSVTGPALLKRFGTRQELMLRALLPQEELKWVSLAEQGPDERPLIDQFETLFGVISDTFIELVPCLAALRQSGIPMREMAERHPSPMRGLKALKTWLEAARRRGLVAGEELETAATAMLGAVQSNIMMAHLYKRNWSTRSQREYVKDLAQLFARALAPRGAAAVRSKATAT